MLPVVFLPGKSYAMLYSYTPGALEEPAMNRSATHLSVWAEKHHLRPASQRWVQLPCRVFGGKDKQLDGVHFGKLPQCPVCVPLAQSGLVDSSEMLLSPDSSLVWAVEVQSAHDSGVHEAHDRLITSVGVQLRSVSYHQMPESVGLYIMVTDQSWMMIDNGFWM